MKKAKTFRLDDVYWDLLKAVIEKSGGQIATETTGVQIAIYELAKKELEEEEMKGIIKEFYDRENS